MAGRDDPGVVVIGAGLAGLTAAVALDRAGHCVEVIEARDRVGGRTWSRQLESGAVVEMGAEFILPGNDRIRALARSHGIDLWDKGVRYGKREPRGGAPVDAQSLELGAITVERALRELPPGDPTSAADLLASLDIGEGVRAALLARIQMSSATSATEVSAHGLDRLGHVDSEPSPGLAGGNQSLSLALAGSLGEKVRLGDPATSVEWDARRVEVATASGETVTARHCVIAVPASVISRIAFSPDLPQEKSEALRSVRYGHAAKLFIPLSEPAPVSAVMNVPECYWCWTETGEGDEPMPLLSCFAGSPAALEGLEVTSGPERWLDSVTTMRPDLLLLTDQAILSTWDDDPWVGAAYSVSPSSKLSDALRAPAGPFVFAGEHTAGEFHGLMEGAVRSGYHAAGLITA